MGRFKFLILSILVGFASNSQERFLQYNSKDSLNQKSRIHGVLGVNLKLNGYYDFYGEYDYRTGSRFWLKEIRF